MFETSGTANTATKGGTNHLGERPSRPNSQSRSPGRQVRTVGQPTMPAKSTRNRTRIPAQMRKTLRNKNRNTRGLETWTQERH